MATTHPPHVVLPTTSRGGARALRIGIWISTGLFGAMLAFSGAMFVAGTPEVVTMLRHLGYPDYFARLLGLAKLAGVAAVVVPLPSPTLREWAYAGFTFVFLSAAASHALSGDPASKIMPSLVALAALMTSYFLRRRAAGHARGEAP